MSTPANKQIDVKADTAKIRFWNRLQLLLVLAVFVAPIAGAFFYKPAAFNNYGDLYQPARPVPNLLMYGLAADDAVAVELDSLRRQWIFLVAANGQCSQACEDNILKMRQLRFMQNNNMLRIRTVFIQTGLPTAVALDLAAKYTPVEVYNVTPDAYQNWTQVLELRDAPPEAQQDRFYIIDPAGNLMMSYPALADPNLIKKDIKRLLKTSQIG